MSTHDANESRLDRLARLARNALEIPQLIDLARQHMPDAAQTLAREQGFSVRQAKAAKALARYRRDAGILAFEALTNPYLEHAPNTSARGKRTMKRTLARALERHAKDPQRQLTLLLEHDEYEEAHAHLVHLIGASGTIYFNARGSGEGSLCRRARGERDVLPDAYLYIHERESNNMLGNSPEGWTVVADFIGLVQALQLQAPQVHSLVEAIVLRLMAQYPTWQGRTNTWLLGGVQMVVRHYQESLDPNVAESAERWWICRYFWNDDCLLQIRAHTRRGWDEEVSRSRHWWHGDTPEEELHPVFDRLRELGVSDEELRAMCLGWLNRHRDTHVHIPFITVLAGSNAFPRYPSGIPKYDAERAAALRRFLPSIWRQMIRGGREKDHGWWLFERLGRLGLYQVHGDVSNPDGGDRLTVETTETFFREQLTMLISHGRLALAYQFLVHFGRLAGQTGKPQAMIRARAYSAFMRAYEDGRVGDAAALSYQFVLGSPDDLVPVVDAELADELSDTHLYLGFDKTPAERLARIQEWSHRPELRPPSEEDEDEEDGEAEQACWTNTRLLAIRWRDRYEELQAELEGRIEEAREDAVLDGESTGIRYGELMVGIKPPF